MFSDVGVHAAYIKGKDNPIADYLSRHNSNTNPFVHSTPG